MVFLSLCLCGGVFVVVFLWRCFCGGVLVVVYKVLFQYYKVLLRTTKYYSVLQSTTPVLLRTTKYYSSTTPYYKVLLRTTKYNSSTTKYYSSTTPYYKVLLQYYSVLRQYYKSFQNEHFVRGFRNFSRNKLPKQGSCEASSKFHRMSFQNERFARCFDASDNFHRKSFQKDRFARCFLQISQKKLPKRAFRAMLPPKFTEQAFKKSVSRDASDNFHRKSFQNDHFVRGFLQVSKNSASKTSVLRDASDNFHQKFAFRYSFARSTHRFLREGSSTKSKMCLALQRRAFPNFHMYVSLYSGVRKNV